MENTYGAISILNFSSQDLFLSFPCKLFLLLGSSRQKSCNDIESEVKNLRLALSDLHLKHKSITMKLQSHQDIEAKNKAELKHLKGNY